MNDAFETKQRTPRAERLIRQARDRMYALSGDPDGCIEQFLPILLAIVRPELRADCEREFRANIHDEQFRMELLIWAYKSSLDLYASGALD